MRQVRFALVMTVNCPKMCEFVRLATSKTEPADPELVCLECILGEHLDNTDTYGTLDIVEQEVISGETVDNSGGECS